MTADNDGNAADPFSATFRTAPAGRAAFRFTSFGDLATPNTAWVLSYGQSAYAVEAVESFQPLFHLLNGDLCYANLNPTAQPEVWRDFGNNNQTSAASRPWMPCLGNHEVEFYNGPQGFTSYLSRYTLPDNRVPGFGGRWYSFRIGSVLFVSLDADDVIFQDAAAFVAGPAALVPAAGTGHPAIKPGTSFYIRGYSGGAQTAWLERTLAAGRRDETVDWIIVQMHQCAASSSSTGNGSDLGIRQEWLPLFDRYQVDLVLCGHDHDYERSFPVRGADTERRPRGGHRGGGQHPAPAPGDDRRQRGVRHQARHRAPHPRLRRHRRPARRVRHRHRRRSAAGQGVHHGRPARRHVHAGRLHPARRRTRWRTPSGRPGATRPPATGSLSSTSTRAQARTASPASRSPTTTRWARTRSTRAPAPRARRPRTTPSSRPSPWSARANTRRVSAAEPATGYGRLMDVLVIGAGAVGLTTAISLAEAGLSVTIRTAALPAQTTSVAAGAVWGAVKVGPPDRVLEWGRIGLEVLSKLAAEPGTGVRLAAGREVSRAPLEPYYWTRLLTDLRDCEESELPDGFTSGWHYTAPLATMPVYLDYLRARFERAGGTLEVSPVASLAELAGAAPVIVNCSGAAAHDLVPDPAVVPVRGQVVIAANPGIEEFLVNRDPEPPWIVYMFPHGDTILLGGTNEEGNRDTDPKPEVAERIVAGCTAIEPRLRGAEILGHRVGLRPWRPEVRLESEPFGDGVLWHNYGHGGAGISMAWGCAAEITRAVLG